MVSTRFGIAALTLGLLGCAGGGGGGGTTQTPQPVTNLPATVPAVVPTPAPTPPAVSADTFRTAEYNLMGGLETVHAADAYARGYTGAGVTIGIVDFNFDLSSSEIAYSSASQGPDAASVALYEAQTGTSSDPSLHGQAVAAAAAARKNDAGIHGLAFDATVLAVDYFSDINETQFKQGGVLYHSSDPFTYLTAHGARIVNTSYGYEAPGSAGGRAAVYEVYITTPPSTAVAKGALLVASAGNAGLSKPALSNYDIAADLQSGGILDSGPGAFIIAGAVNSNNTIATFSDRAGSLANYYMVAPGTNLMLPWNGSLTSISGTSFSAPLISGAAAIVMQRWPTLTARQVADILFQSATDLGAPGVDAVYGHGLLNVDAALQPMGTTTFATSDGTGASTTMTMMSLGTAFGDAPAFRASLHDATILDRFGRDYALDLSGAAQPRPAFPDLFGVMQQRTGWRFAGLPLGEQSRFDLDVRANLTDGIAPFGPSGGIEAGLAEHQMVARFEGAMGAMGWIAGTGLSLHDALLPVGPGDPFTALTLTQGFMQAAGSGPGSFAGLRLALDSDTEIAFGGSFNENQGIPSFYLSKPYHNAGQSVAMRLDHSIGASSVGLELGSLREEGGVLGSLASGGLKMADGASTTWLTASYEQALPDRWRLKAAMTVSGTAATSPAASLITAIGPVYATSFAFGIGRESVFDAGDAWTFAVDQPLRAESAPVALALGAGINPATGKVMMTDAQTSLTPSGREFDFETGYRFPLGDWNGAVNLAYSLDAGHLQGVNAVAGLIWISRKF